MSDFQVYASYLICGLLAIGFLISLVVIIKNLTTASGRSWLRTNEGLNISLTFLLLIATGIFGYFQVDANKRNEEIALKGLRVAETTMVEARKSKFEYLGWWYGIEPEKDGDFTFHVKAARRATTDQLAGYEISITPVFYDKKNVRVDDPDKVDGMELVVGHDKWPMKPSPAKDSNVQTDVLKIPSILAELRKKYVDGVSREKLTSSQYELRAFRIRLSYWPFSDQKPKYLMQDYKDIREIQIRSPDNLYPMPIKTGEWEREK